MKRSRASVCLLPMLLAFAGCQPVPAAMSPEVEPVAELGTQFQANATGAIAGQVVWTGDAPVVEPFAVLPMSLNYEFAKGKVLRKNPNTPAIDPQSRGVGNAVVFLRGVSPVVSRPWDLPPVQVAIRDYRFDVHQGSGVGRYGFVRRGKSVEIVSRQPVHQMVRATGSAYFNLALVEPEQPRTRTLPRNGVVELSSAINFFWMRAYLFVDDHPYYACTDPSGRFVLRDVPPGRYELVCWMPSWREASRDLDPEWGMVLRVTYDRPLEKLQSVTVETGRTLDARFEMRTADFLGDEPSSESR
jgi:hypothetical protein